jgi:hypothetical protein
MPDYKVWVGGTSTDPTVAGNWSPSGVPVDGDHVIIDGRATKAIAGADQSAIELGSLRIYKSMSYDVGSRAAPWKIGPALCEIGLSSESGNAQQSGPSTIVLDFTGDQVLCIVHDARDAAADGGNCVLLTGTHVSNQIVVHGGSVGIGAKFPGEATTVAQLDVDGDTAQVYVGFGVTLTTANQNGGNAVLNCPATTVNQEAGSLETRGSGAITTLNIRGTAVLNSTGTITTVNLAGAGFADFGKSPAVRTVTNFKMYGNACRMNANSNAYNSGAPVLALTNGIETLEGANISQVTMPTNIRASFATL